VIAPCFTEGRGLAASQVVPNGEVTDTEGLPHQLRRDLLGSPAPPQRGTTPRVVRQAPVRLPSSRGWRTSQGLVIVGKRFRPLAVPVPNEQTRLSASPLAARLYNALPLPNLRAAAKIQAFQVPSRTPSERWEAETRDRP
jgi:hypothetical protein